MMPPTGVALYVSRIPMSPDVNAATLATMEANLPRSAALFPPGATLDVIGFGCTSAATVIGPDRVANAVATARPECGVTEPLSALIAAGRAISASRLGFVTPYAPEVSALMRERLVDAGFEIVSFGSFEESDDRVVARIAPSSILEAIERVAAEGDCDAVVVSCTNLRCLDILAVAEARIGRPVLTSNQAMAWHMLRLAGVPDGCPQAGRLFETSL